MWPTCSYFHLLGPIICFFFSTVFTKGFPGYPFCVVMHIQYLVIKHQNMVGQCAGKKSGEESLCSFPSTTLTLLIFASHQCVCSSTMSFIRKTLDTTFRSIRPINISISSFTFNFLFLIKHTRGWRRSLSFIFFCVQNSC